MTTKSPMPALLPCPFCGKRAELIKAPFDDTEYFVECCECAARGPNWQRAKTAVTTWNARVPEPVTVGGGDALKIVDDRIGTYKCKLQNENPSPETAAELRFAVEALDIVRYQLISTPDHAAQVGDETAWLVERHHPDRIEYVYFDTYGLHWTTDVNKAMRLCRREDAEQLASGSFDEDDVRIAEHEWCALKPNPVAAESEV